MPPPPATHNISGDSEFGVRPAPCSLPSHSTHDPQRASLQEPHSLNTPRGLLCSASLRPHPHTLPKRLVLTCAHSPSHAHALTRRLADFHLLYQTQGVRLGPLLSLSRSWGLAAGTFFTFIRPQVQSRPAGSLIKMEFKRLFCLYCLLRKAGDRVFS